MEVVSTMEISGEEREIADAYAREQITTLSSDTSSMKEKISAITQDISGLSSDASDITVGISTGLFGGWKKIKGLSDHVVRAITFAEGHFIAVGRYITDDELFSSEDGVNWDIYKDALRGNAGLFAGKLVYGNEIILSDQGGEYIQFSRLSQITEKWNTVGAIGDTSEASMVGITYGNGKFVMLKGDGNVYYADETDIYTWSKATTLGEGYYGSGSIAFGNGLFVVTIGGVIYYSSDLETWTTGASDYYNIRYCNNKFFVSNGKQMFYSEDAINWTEGYTFPNSVYGISYGKGKYVAVGKSGMIAYSEDLENWTVCICGEEDFYQVAFGNDEFVVIGGNKYRSDVLRNYRNLEDVINEILQTT